MLAIRRLITPIQGSLQQQQLMEDVEEQEEEEEEGDQQLDGWI